MSNETQSAPEGAQKAEKSAKNSNICVAKASTSFEEILQWDREGARIIFAHEKGSFKELDESELLQLSAYTKSVYSMMRELNRKHDPEGDAFQHQFKVGDTPHPFGGPLGRIRNIAVAKGLVKGLLRPDQVDEAMGRGWRYPREGEVTGGIHKREGHYEIAFPSTGQTEQVLLVKDAKQDRDDAWEFTRERIAVGEQKSDAIREQINQSGVATATDAE